MNKPKYLYKTEDKFIIYEFVSEGPKGSIKKMVEYTETATANVYNLGFGDYDETTKSINDISVTNNGDSLKILATGSTNVRTRLYRMGITNNLAEITEDFIVYGFTEQGIWEEFEVGEDYEAFLIKKK